MSETNSYYVETRYLAPTNYKGARIRLVSPDTRKVFDEVAFDYALGGGVEQHRHAVARACSGLVQVAFDTKRGYVFAVTPGKVA